MQLSETVRNALEECAECLYAVDEKTKKIVYCSSALKKNNTFDPVGTECYKYLFEKTEVCSFCPSLNENGSLYKWEMFDVSCKSWLSIKNRLVSDNGTVYRVGCINKIQELMNLTKDVVGEVSSLNDLLRRQEQLKYLLEWEADHDMMTRLFNRGRYMKDLETVFPQSCEIAIIYMDINNLKWANDNIGYNAGDALIKCIAGLLEERITDKIRSYRLGGD